MFGFDRVAIGLWLILTGMLAACGAQDSGDPADPVIFGPDGGVLSGPGGLVLEIPLGALSEELSLSVQEVAMPASDLVQVSRFYRLEPAETVFLVPATLRIPYNPEAVPKGRRESEIRLYRLDDAGGTMLAAEESPDRNRQVARASVTRLGTWGAALPAPEAAALPGALSAPGEVDFGLVPVGEAETQTLLLRNEGAGDLILAGVNLEQGEAFSLSQPPAPETRIPPYSELVLPLVFSPAAQQAYTDTLVIGSSDTRRPEWRIPVQGRGAGGGRIAVEPESLDFAATPLGETESRSLTLRNEGDGPLMLLEFELVAGGIFALAQPSPPSRLEAGEQTEITVVFAPAEAVFYQQDLRIHSDDDERPQVDVRLGAEGVAAR